MYDPTTLAPGDVLLMTGRPRLTLGGLLDAAIEWSTVSPFVHAAIVAEGCMVEALWTVTRSPLDKYAGDGWAYRVQATPEQAQAACGWATDRVGQRYGIAELMDDALFDAAHIPLYGRVTPHRLTCSGLVSVAYQKAGINLTWHPFPSPADLSFSPLLLGPRPWKGAA
ncbi:hypothetical protein [Thiomonas sp.]